MSDFYRISVEERTDRLTRLAVAALAHWGVRDDAPVPAKIRENAVYRVTAPDGRPAALRVHRHAYHTDAELESELAWTEALRAAGIEAPGLVPTRAGAPFVTVAHPAVPEPRQVDMLLWLDGAPIGSVEHGIGAGTDIRDAYTKVGALTARMHNHAAAWPLPSGFTRHSWDLDGLTGEQPFWGRFWELDGLSPAQRDLIETARARARAALIAYGQSPETYGLIHADLIADNLLFDGERVRPIDFDDAGFGWHLFDLATISTFYWGEPIFERLRAAVIDGYRSERPLPDATLAHMPLFHLLRGFTYLGWVHTRRETESAQAITPDVIALGCALAEDYLSG